MIICAYAHARAHTKHPHTHPNKHKRTRAHMHTHTEAHMHMNTDTDIDKHAHMYTRTDTDTGTDTDTDTDTDRNDTCPGREMSLEAVIRHRSDGLSFAACVRGAQIRLDHSRHLALTREPRDFENTSNLRVRQREGKRGGRLHAPGRPPPGAADGRE